MKARRGFLLAVLALALARKQPAQTTPITVSINPQATCFNLGGTFQVEGFATNVSGGPLSGFQMGFCAAGASIFQPVAGSANQPPGGTGQNQTCPTFGSTGILFTATGSWPSGQKNGVLVDFAVSTSSPPTSIPIEVTASDGTHPPASSTFSMPACAAAGPVLQITKSLSPGIKLVNGHLRQGDYVEFTITITNTGSEFTPASFTVTDTLASGFSGPIGFGSRCSEEGQTVTCTPPDSLSPGQMKVITVATIANAKGEFENVAMVVGGGAPPATSNTVSVEVLGARPNPVRVGTPPIRDLSGRPVGNN